MSYEMMSEELVLKAQAGDRDSLEKLVANMTPAVGKHARTLYEGTHNDKRDLVQAGIEGVLMALRTFEPGRASFESWCWGPMRKAMASAKAESFSGPLVNRETLREYQKALDLAEGDPAEAVHYLGNISEDTFRDVHEAVKGTVSPYSFTLPGETEARFEIESGDDVEADVATRVLIESFLDYLGDLDREIVVLYYGLGGQAPMIDAEISAIVGKPQQTVNRRRLKALALMKKGRS